MGRTFALNMAAVQLGLEKPTRRAMTYIDDITRGLERRGLTWDDVPDRYRAKDIYPKSIGGQVALLFARTDVGFRTVEASQSDPDLKYSLLSAYVQCQEFVSRGMTATMFQAVQFSLAKAEGRTDFETGFTMEVVTLDLPPADN